MPTKSGSSVELGPLYWQLEVGAVVTSEFECSGGKDNEQDVNDRRKNETWFLFQQTSARDFSHFLCLLIQDGKFSPRSPEQDNGGGSRLGMESGYCCVYLPDGSASLAPTRDGQLIKDMLSSLCEKRGFPLKDVVIYLNGKDKVGAWLLCSHHAIRQSFDDY